MHAWFHVQLDQKILDGLYCCCCTVSDACVWHVCTLAATFQEETDCERESPALARDGGEIAFPQPVVSAWVSLGAMTLTNFVI